MDEDNFHDSGPKHMMSANSKIIIDWDNDEHRRCVTACLVNATYVMEKDAINRRMYGTELAPAWWERFNFKLKKTFKYDSDENCQFAFFLEPGFPLFPLLKNQTTNHDVAKYEERKEGGASSSISRFTYGAIFEHMAPQLHPSAPQYVVAFRGTMIEHPNVLYDMVQNSFLMLNILSSHERFKRAYSDVDSLISDLPNGSCSVWLAGHSLGASMALEIGRGKMLEKELNFPTFLFNPPHVSLGPVIDKALKGNAKTVVQVARGLLKFTLVWFLSGHDEHTEQLFQRLTPWVPELHVSPKDLICRGYIEYFEQRERVGKDHPRCARAAARVSYRDMFSYLFGRYRNAQPHLLPSARLRTNSSEDKKEAHGLRQWWKPDSELELVTKRYDQPLGPSA